MRTKCILFRCFLAAIFVVFGVYQSAACTCAGPRTFGGKNFQPCGVFWRADVVFIGKVDKISYEKEGIGEKARYSKMIAHFSVEKAVRGVNEQTVQVETSPSTASCGYPFKEGEEYFVYLTRGQDGKLAEHLCGATVLLKNAQPDLEYLNAVESGEKGGRVFGNVWRYAQASFKDRVSNAGLAGINVKLSSVEVEDVGKKNKPKYIKRSFETKTNEDGFYMFLGVPEGTYIVEADIPKNFRELRSQGDSFPRFVTIDGDKQRCGGPNFSLTTLGSLEGKVTNQDGSWPPQQYIWLIPLDETGKLDLSSYYAYTWISSRDGTFHFDTVAPGNYLLAVNPKSCPNKNYAPEYGSSFYPGVADYRNARSISISEFERRKVENFRLLPTLKDRVFAGKVVSTNGTPVSGATVFLNNGNVNRCMALGSLDETKTDDSGVFRLKGYEGYEYQLRA